MHLAHKTLRFLRPFSKTLMVCKFGRNVLGVAFFDQGRLRPNAVVLPQCAHFAIITLPYYNLGESNAQRMDSNLSVNSRAILPHQAALYKPI